MAKQRTPASPPHKTDSGEVTEALVAMTPLGSAPSLWFELPVRTATGALQALDAMRREFGERSEPAAAPQAWLEAQMSLLTELGLRWSQWQWHTVTQWLDAQASFMREVESLLREALRPAVVQANVGVGSVQAVLREWQAGGSAFGPWSEAAKVWLDALEHDVRA